MISIGFHLSFRPPTSYSLNHSPDKTTLLTCFDHVTHLITFTGFPLSRAKFPKYIPQNTCPTRFPLKTRVQRYIGKHRTLISFLKIHNESQYHKVCKNVMSLLSKNFVLRICLYINSLTCISNLVFWYAHSSGLICSKKNSWFFYFP